MLGQGPLLGHIEEPLHFLGNHLRADVSAVCLAVGQPDVEQGILRSEPLLPQPPREALHASQVPVAGRERCGLPLLLHALSRRRILSRVRWIAWFGQLAMTTSATASRNKDQRKTSYNQTSRCRTIAFPQSFLGTSVFCQPLCLARRTLFLSFVKLFEFLLAPFDSVLIIFSYGLHQGFRICYGFSGDLKLLLHVRAIFVGQQILRENRCVREIDTRQQYKGTCQPQHQLRRISPVKSGKAKELGLWGEPERPFAHSFEHVVRLLLHQRVCLQGPNSRF